MNLQSSMERYTTNYSLGYESLGFFRRTIQEKELDQTNSIFGSEKRLMDILLSTVILIISFPLVIIISILIKLTSSGPVIFNQKRVGKDGKIFKIYKFRTLKEEAKRYNYSPEIKERDEVTKLGKFLRTSCLDEIPQFINVLKGEMSIVGPRPEMEFITKKYNFIEKKRLSVKPGITGIWQIKASRKQMIHENIEYDLEYLENVSLKLDTKIMLLTLLFIIRKIIKYAKVSFIHSSKSSCPSR